MKFIKGFRGCKKGQVFPTDFKVGDNCPKELEFAATAAGAVEGIEARKASALQDMTVDQLKQLAADQGIDLAGVSKKDDIIAAIELAAEQ